MNIPWSKVLSHAGSDVTLALSVLAAVPSSPVAESLPPTWKAPVMTAGFASALVLRAIAAGGAQAVPAIAKTASVLLVLFFLLGCSTTQGVRIYTPVKSEDPKTGAVTQHTALLASLNADLPGVKSLEVSPKGALTLTFNELNAMETTPVLDKNGAVIGQTSKPIVSGIFATPVIAAGGAADRQRIDGTAAGLSGLAAWFFTPTALAKGASSAAGTLAH